MDRALNLALAGCFALCLLCYVAMFGAPAPAPRPGPDHITGPLDTQMSSPVVLVGDGDDKVIWLVFTKPDDEVRELGSLTADGHTRVTVRGQLGAGGKYRYIVVSSVARED